MQRRRLTIDEALAKAQAEADRRWTEPEGRRPPRRQDAAVDVWEHIGGDTPNGIQVATGRLITRPATAAPPRWGVWKKLLTRQPA
jgi:hypothetical protein